MLNRIFFFVLFTFLLSCSSDNQEENNIFQDTTPPEITLIGASTINLIFGTAYEEFGATATDDVDGDITSSIVIGGATVEPTVPNIYYITYDVSDAAGNVADQIVRTVVVLPDTNVPIITLIGEAIIELPFSEIFEDPGASAVDDIDGDISSEVVIGGDVVNSNIVGSYLITYNVSDQSGNAAEEVIRTVIVLPDTTPPIITLVGEAAIDLAFTEVYQDPGATAVDDIDGDISSEIIIGGDIVNSNIAGSYMITYNVSDQSGNTAEEIVRTVNVLPDTSPPVLTLNGEATIDLPFGELFQDPGATAFDDIDGDISSEIVIGGDVVNSNVTGTYTITYNVSDQSDNAAEEVVRTVNVANQPLSSIIAECHLFSYDQSTDTTSLSAKYRFDINGRIASVEEITTGIEYFYNFDSDGKLTSITTSGNINSTFLEIFYDANDRITQINDRTFVFNPNMSDYINTTNFTFSNVFSEGFSDFYLETSSINSITGGGNTEYTFNVLFTDESGFNSNFIQGTEVSVFPDGTTSQNTNTNFLVQNKYYIRYDEDNLLRRIGIDWDFEWINYTNSTLNPLHQDQTNLLHIFSFVQSDPELYNTSILFNLHLFSDLNIKTHLLDEGPYNLFRIDYQLNILDSPISSTRKRFNNSGVNLVYSHIEMYYYYQGDEIPD